MLLTHVRTSRSGRHDFFGRSVVASLVKDTARVADTTSVSGEIAGISSLFSE
jgi:hypothetical protein